MFTSLNYTQLEARAPAPRHQVLRPRARPVALQPGLTRTPEQRRLEAFIRRQPQVQDALLVERPGHVPGRRWVAYVAAPGADVALLGRLYAEVEMNWAGLESPVAYVLLDALPAATRLPDALADYTQLPSLEDPSLGLRRFEAPVGPVEARVARLWAELLEVPALGRHADFFGLGGDALLGLRMVHRLRQAYPVELGVKDVHLHPVLRDFSRVVGQRLHAARGKRALPVRPEGHLRPLFLVHSCNGDIDYARHLATHLDPDLPVYGLSASGLHDDESPWQSVEDMAAAYVTAIREVQPEGPYRVAGWAGGGMVAYEMARQLIGADQAVEFLGLIDTPCAYPWPASPPEAGAQPAPVPAALEDWILALHWLAPGTDASVQRELAHEAKGRHVEALLRAAQRLGQWPGTEPLEQIGRELGVRHAIAGALSHYERPPLPVPVSLFMSRHAAAREALLAWTHARGLSVQAHALSADGDRLMDGGQVELLAASLGARLAQCGGPAVPEAAYAPRIVIKTGSGNARPLFCVPGAGASITAFSGLAGVLDASTPLHGLQPRGLCGVMVPHQDVKSAARAYVAALRQEQRHGPYRLLGHSFGGWVAFEMACQLRAAGEVVDPLILLDTEAPCDAVPGHSRAAMLMKLVNIYEMSLGRPLALSEADFDALDHAGQTALLHSRLVAARVMPTRGGLDMLRGIVRVFSTNLNTPYLPSHHFDGSLMLVTVADVEHGADAVASNQAWADAWAPHAAQVRAWVAPGNHMSLLSSPHVDALAAYLQPHLWTTA